VRRPVGVRCQNRAILKELLVLIGAFAAGTGIALLAGAKNLGTGLTIGQLTFAAALAAVLLLAGRRRR
jgi:hypothetical protein